MRRCSKCGSEFQDWVTDCLDCGNALSGNKKLAEANGQTESPVKDTIIPDKVRILKPGQPVEAESQVTADTDREPEEDDEYEDEEEETDDGELEAWDGDNLEEDSLDDYVDEVIQDSDFVNPDAEDDYGEKIEVNPRANLVSVFQSGSDDAIKKAAVALNNADIKLYLLKKSGVFNYFYILMVETGDEEKANQILEETDGGNLEPVDPNVEDPELKDAPVINLDEIQARAKNPTREAEAAGKVEDVPVNCPVCQSKNIETKHSFFSAKTRLKCRDCNNTWTPE